MPRAATALLALATLGACTKATEPPPVVDAGAQDSGRGGVDAGPPDFGGPDDGITHERCSPDGGMVPLGGACSSPADCDDGCYCDGPETCAGGVCVAGDDPCASLTTELCASTACLEELNHCYTQAHDERCADGDACNGRETCDPILGCVAGELTSCDDENPCTIDSCDVTTGCVFSPRDLDGDGYLDGRCGGDDCVDLPPDGAAIHPGAVEVCDNNRDDNCDGLRDYDDPTCIPTNDVCATARMLPGRGTYSGATRSLHADYTPSCGSTTGADAVFSFTTTDLADIRVAFAGGGGGTVALRRLDDCATGPDLRCNASTTSPSLLARSQDPGTYAIIVKTATTAAFSLSLGIDPPSGVPAGDDCAHPVIVTPDGPSASSDFSMLGLDYSPSCLSSTSSYRDTVFVFALGATRDVTISVTTPSTFNDVVSVYSDPCGTSIGQLRCHSLSRNTDTEFFRSLSGGSSYYVIVSSQMTGMATVSVTTAPPTVVPANDRCSGAIVLSPPYGIRATETMIGFSSDAPNPTCFFAFGATAPDSFYTFHIDGPRPGSITAFAREPAGSTTPMYMDLHSTCTSPELSGACASGTITSGHEVTTLDVTGLAAGNYILQVDQDTRFSSATNYSLEWILDSGAP